MNSVEMDLQREEPNQEDQVQKLVGDINWLRTVVETLAQRFQKFMQASSAQQQTVPVPVSTATYTQAQTTVTIPATTITTTTATSTQSILTAASSGSVSMVQSHADVFGIRAAYISASAEAAENSFLYSSARESERADQFHGVQNATATTVGREFCEQQQTNAQRYLAEDSTALYGSNQHTLRGKNSGLNARDIASMLPEFDPCNNDVTSTQFIERIEQLKQAHGSTDGLLLVAVHTKLQGSAKFWINSQSVFLRWVRVVVDLK